MSNRPSHYDTEPRERPDGRDLYEVLFQDPDFTLYRELTGTTEREDRAYHGRKRVSLMLQRHIERRARLLSS